MTEQLPVDRLGYEQARDELAEVVRALETGGIGLDESVALWERGEALARRCDEQLAGARERVRKVLEATGPGNGGTGNGGTGNGGTDDGAAGR